MAGKSRKWPEGCAIGCGALVVLGLVFGAITWLGMMQLSHKAIESRAALDQAYPSQETFTPALDGSIAPDRIERFVAVREALMAACPPFTEHRAVFQRMQKYDEAEEEPPAGEFLNVTGSMPKTLWRIGRDVHNYAIARNGALLEHELGLGEYTWIFVVAYYGWLGHEPVDFLLEDDEKPKVYSGRVRGEVIDMIGRHLTELEEALAAGTGSAPAGADRSLPLWRAELVALQNDPVRRPFQDGLPPELERSLAPFRADLEPLFCPATCELDLTQTIKTGLWYDHR